MNRFVQFLFVLACFSLLIGCSDSNTADKTDQGTSVSLQGVKLTLAVNGDESLADAIEKLTGEWQAQTGSTLKVVRLNATSVEELKKAKADALLTASHMLGPLAEAKMVVPLDLSVLKADPLHWIETFELPRLPEAKWGENLYGISFGSPVLVCYYRPDLFEKLGIDPPKTWEEYYAAAEKLSDPKKLGDLVTVKADRWHAVAEPYGSEWAAITFLARAVSSAKHRDNYSVLFRSSLPDLSHELTEQEIKQKYEDAFSPQIISLPMRRAMKLMVDTSRYAASPEEATDPDATRRLFWEGRVAMALTWPTATAELPESAKASPVPMAVMPLPGSREVYNIDEDWKMEYRDKDQSWQVPLLGIAGRLGTVCQSSQHQAAAVRLLLWLSGNTSRPVPASRSQATTLYRQGQISQAGQWTESPILPEAASHYAEVTKTTMQSDQWVFALRIPGRNEYLDSLSKAVRAAMKFKNGEQAELFLLNAQEEWKNIAKKRGSEKQLQAYRCSLGLAP